MTANAIQSSAVYFYQQRGHVRHIKRFKKQPDQLPASLRGLLSTKSGKRRNGDDGTDQTQSLSTRLAELAMLTDESLDSYSNLPPGTASTNKRGITARSNATLNPMMYTDARLTALKQLTESLLQELQEYLNRFEEAQMRPVLSGPVIYELHADWSDLTLTCTYEEFPQWRTRHGRDLMTKQSKRQNDDDAASTTSSDGVHSRTASAAGPTTPGSTHRPILANTSKKGGADKRPGGYVPPRLDPITEEKHTKRFSVTSNEGDTSLTQSNPSRGGGEQPRTSIIQFGGITEAPRVRTNSIPRKMSILKPAVQQQQNLELTRMSGNSSTMSGWALTFNLSNSLYEEKGWTILTERIDQQPIDFERRALRCINKSLNNIDESRIRNERFGLNKVCKIRFYGDHKREQIEKYKSTNLKPKKSMFAMQILRREIPKPLDYDAIVDSLYTVSNLLLSSSMGSMSAMSQTNTNDAASVSMAGGPRTLCSTHTNDGSMIVYYPSGRIAITCATVYGYYIESNANSSVFSTTMNSSGGLQQQLSTSTNRTSEQAGLNQQGSMDASFSKKESASNLNVNSAVIKDSYTTVIYDDVKPRGGVGLAGSGEFATLASAATRTTTPKTTTTTTPNTLAEGRLMALITSSGYCICFRRNGNPRFICSESGGMLCNEKGLVTYQWKWDEIKPVELSRIKDDLKAQLNEHISIEYENPYSILVKYECQKEVFDFDLGINKDNAHRLHELLAKTVSDAPLHSKTASHKLTKAIKNNTLKAPPPYQQTPVRKPSALQRDNDSSRSMVEKLLDNSITYKDVPIMKELLTIQKKIRGIFDEWLQYCRMSLGVLEPDKYILPDFPKSRNLNEYHAYFNKITIMRRKSKSAELKKDDTRIPTFVPRPVVYERSKSAYMTRRKTRYNKDLAERISDFKKEMSGFSLGGDKAKRRRRKQTSSASASAKRASHSLIMAPLSEEQRMFRMHRSRTYISSDLSTSEEQCPITLRYKILFDRKVDCKCRRNVVPVLSDVEFDKFLRVVSPEQLIVIAVINSNETSVSYIENSFEQLYESFNRNCVRPCIQSFKEEYRFLFYDTLTATNNSNHYQPLLIQRHNVMPGMVLMYQGGKLLFCDHIFNGYGYSLHDFIKQLHQSKLDAKASKFLPYNFRFNRPRGPHGPRSAWGGEIGGLILVDSTTNLSPKHLTTSLDSFTRKRRPVTGESILINNNNNNNNNTQKLGLRKENTTIPIRDSNYLTLPKIKQQSVEA